MEQQHNNQLFQQTYQHFHDQDAIQAKLDSTIHNS